ncbi:MAG: S41 family peptidase [Clostridia bacterium]|nr:S41 family peptidase [Clostridia bacterium]
MKKKPILITAVITALCVFLLTTYLYTTPAGTLVFSHLSDTVTGKNYAKFAQLEYLIENEYMGSYTDHVLMDNALHMYVASLNDPYSTFFNKSEYEEFSSGLEGDYRGIGVTVKNENGRILITNVQNNSPAQKGGILPGDILVKVNGTEYNGGQMSSAVSAIKKHSVGQSLTITVERDGILKDFTIVIEDIKLELVSSKILENFIGYVRIQSFGNEVAALFKKNVEEMKEKGIKGLIIDLRSNPGGALTTAVEIGDYLIGEGELLTVRDKDGKEKVYKSKKGELELPMCVLINENSASASELVAGALRDYNKATLIGKKTYGKGVVQSVFDLGDETALRLTIAKYYTPSGECIHGKGISPDVEVGLPEGVSISQNDKEIENDTQLDAAIEEMKRLMTQGEI